MVRGVAPLFARVRVWVEDWPETTWPKLSTDWPGMRLPVIARVLEPTP
jgi:hypothetical protein